MRIHRLVAGTALAGVLLGLAVEPSTALPSASTRLTTHLTFASTTAHVGEWIAYTVTAAPSTTAFGKRVRVQVRGKEQWETIGTMQFDRAGQAHGKVTGRAAGIGNYKAQVLSRGGTVISTSNVVKVIWSAVQ
ncbi:MAG: hypothetical protein WC005_01070 [Candidatus Nanopelagicales bacterium]